MTASAFEQFLGTLPKLTWTEERLMHALWAADGAWVQHSALLRAGWAAWYRGGPNAGCETSEQHLVRVNICRLRKKLAGSVWQVESVNNGHHAPERRQHLGCYRLVIAKAVAV